MGRSSSPSFTQHPPQAALHGPMPPNCPDLGRAVGAKARRALWKGGPCSTVGQPEELSLVRLQAIAAQTHTTVQVRPQDTTC